MLRMLLTEHATVPWQALVYLIAEVTYGGRVTDRWDKRCLMNIVEKFCSPDCLEDGFSYTSCEVCLNDCSIRFSRTVVGPRAATYI